MLLAQVFSQRHMMTQVVRDAFPGLQADFVTQQTAKGWGDAVHCTLKTLPDIAADVIIASGNLVLLTSAFLDTIAKQVAVRRGETFPCLTVGNEDEGPLLHGTVVAHLHERASRDGAPVSPGGHLLLFQAS